MITHHRCDRKYNLVIYLRRFQTRLAGTCCRQKLSNNTVSITSLPILSTALDSTWYAGATAIITVGTGKLHHFHRYDRKIVKDELVYEKFIFNSLLFLFIVGRTVKIYSKKKYAEIIYLITQYNDLDLLSSR